MKKIITLLTFVFACIIFLGAGSACAQAATTFPSETNSFVSNYYIDATDVDKPFFDKVLPEIRKNIKENNKHSVTPYYDAFPVANNPENFQGLGSTTYANINGKKVTAEAFYRVYGEGLNDPNCGMGLMIYQCIEYKRLHPEQDVKITFSSYRTSVTASVCVIPESKYYGYMRSLYGTNYDEQGFVRISYMLVEAARMGIEVTTINQLPSYAVSQYNPKTGKTESRSHINFETYFNKALKTNCYDKYAKGKKVSDFFNFVVVGWTIKDKTNDMQHVKSATVSHYLATDGTEHKSAVFFSSSNLDENNYKGCNGNGYSQSGVIVSDHDQLYRTTYNYMQLMDEYSGKEDLFELRKLVNELNEKQYKLIKSGKADKIPADEQIIYVGTDKDPVFELYFTPLGGGADAWTKDYNPICKYVDKMPDSTDYVEFIWNEYGYGQCHVGYTMERMLARTFCEKPNINNKFYIGVTGFDSSEIQKLNVGTQIGYRSVKSGSRLHAKDILVSYAEKGVRHNVSIMTSCNFYMIAFNHRTNSMLVINETEKSGGDFYKIFGQKYSDNMIKRNLTVSPLNLTLEVGQKHTPKIDCPANTSVELSSSKTSVATISSGAIVAKKAGSANVTVTAGNEKATIKVKVVNCIDCENSKNGHSFNIDEQYSLTKQLSAMPLTFEASFSVKKESLKGTTTILGNDGLYDPAIVYSLNKNGQPRVAIRNIAHPSLQSVYVFSNVNVATGEKVHLSIVSDFANKQMHCYVNGVLMQTISGIAAVEPYVGKHNYLIGGDHTNGNPTHFTGQISSVSVWSDIRTASEIKNDYSKGITYTDSKLLASYDLTKCAEHMKADLSASKNNLENIALWQSKNKVEPVGNYDYSFAVVGDTQTMCEADPGAMEGLYDWLVENKDKQKIKYVIGLGDITDDSTDTEWTRAKKYISKLKNKIPYVLTRGNHDDWDDFNRNLHDGFYEKTIDGMMVPGNIELTDPNQPGLVEKVMPDGSVQILTREDDVPEGGTVKGDLTNSYRYFSVQGTDYLLLTLDFAPNGEMLKWAENVIKNHPNHSVIVVTHAYMYRDGTTMDANDLYPPSYYAGYDDAQDGDVMWEKCFSKYENVLMVLSGHDPWQHIAYRQDKGVKGNTVTQMLIDAQYVDRNIGSTAMVAMFYFSNGGEKLTVRYYSVEKDCYGSALSQFTVNLKEHKHNYKTKTSKATLSANGSEVISCTGCGYNKSVTYYTPKTFTLSQTEYVYDKRMKKPAVTVKDSKGNKLKEDIDYTVSYESGRKAIGKYTVTVTFKGNYSGTKKLTFTVKPGVTDKITASQTTSSITLKWSKVAGADGYRVYSYNSSTKKYSNIASVKTNTVKIEKLNPGTNYKYKVIAYTKNDSTIWGDYSAVLETATKPAAPKITKISASSGKVSLTWSNISGESGYQVYYSAKKSSGYKKVNSYKTNVVKSSKSKLTKGKTYYFKVRAYKKVGDLTLYSSYSDIKSIKVK